MNADREAGFDCVVDASLGIKLFLVEPLSDQADALFGHLDDDPPSRFYVPDLFFIECANILWKYVHRFGYPSHAAQQDIADLIKLPLRVDHFVAEIRLPRAHRFSGGVVRLDAHRSNEQQRIRLSRLLRIELPGAKQVLPRRAQGGGQGIAGRQGTIEIGRSQDNPFRLEYDCVGTAFEIDWAASRAVRTFIGDDGV